MGLALKSGAFYDNSNPWNTIIVSDDDDGNNYEILFSSVDQIVYTALSVLSPTINNLFTDEYTGTIWSLHTSNGLFSVEQFSGEHLRGSGTGAAKRRGVPFSVKVDSNNDHYAVSEKLSILMTNDSTGLNSTFDASSFSEIIKSVPDISTATTNPVVAGSILVSVPTGHGISSGDVIRISYAGNIEYRYVKIVDANNLILKVPLKYNYSQSSQVIVVGNTGIYTSVLICYEAGSHTGILNSPGGNSVVSIEVLDETEVEASLKAQVILDIIEDHKFKKDTVYTGYA